MAGRASIHQSWILVAPSPEDVQGRPDLYWNADDHAWSDTPDEASEHTAAERDAVDLTRFDDDVEWWGRQGS